jgi:hypothetical protein
LQLAAARMTPASGQTSKAINNITTLDDLEAIRITSTLSDIGSAVNSKSSGDKSANQNPFPRI